MSVVSQPHSPPGEAPAPARVVTVHCGAAEMLKINPHTLRARMRKLGIVWGKFRQREGEA